MERVVPRERNLLLKSLSAADFQLIEPYLNPQAFSQHKILFEPGQSVSYAYFPYDAVVSLVVTLSTGEVIEAAMVARDGLVGAAAALNGKIAINRAIVQITGDGAACDVEALKRAAMQSPTLHSLLIRHEQVVYAQAQQSAACNATHTIEERLARWLLRARDLARSDTLPFTQEFLAEMLGVRRTSVSMVAHTLQQAGLLKYARGRIQIVDLEGMQENACECYETVSRHYDLLLGVRNNSNVACWHVRYWPKADMRYCAAHVCFRG
jgi:CRP-like cAMP-binding protein